MGESNNKININKFFCFNQIHFLDSDANVGIISNRDLMIAVNTE
jgi:hypothetical protein